jgi:hypothetical protein
LDDDELDGRAGNFNGAFHLQLLSSLKIIRGRLSTATIKVFHQGSRGIPPLSPNMQGEPKRFTYLSPRSHSKRTFCGIVLNSTNQGNQQRHALGFFTSIESSQTNNPN